MADEIVRNIAVTPQLELDALYGAKEIAPWMKLSVRRVLELAREGKLPCVRLNERVVRFHPRSILSVK
jgi:hypothetical protein